MGRPLSDLTTRLSYPDLATDAQRVLDDLSVAELEVSHADGRFFLARMRPYRTEEDRIAGVVLTFVDITARTGAEDALRESENQFRSFVAATADTIYKMSADWVQMRFLEGKQFLADTSAPSRTWLETYIPHADRPQVLAAFRDAIRRKRPFELEHRVIRANGAVGWVFSRAVPILDRQGEIVEWVGAASDVTERRRAEQALRESEERFRAVANVVPDLLWSSDAGGEMTWYNERWLEYTGQTMAEATGGGWAAAIHPDDREASVRRAREAVESGLPLQLEHRVRCASGEYRSFLVRAVPQRDEEGRALRWYGSATDIDDLIRARAQAEAANQAKDQFLAVLSHELRTPLTPVMMAVHLLARNPDLPESAYPSLETIQRNVQIEASFIDDLLDLTKIAHGKLEIVREPTDLHEAVRAAVEIAAGDLQGKNQTLAVALEAADSQVQGDATRLQQVFWNLLKNASKFTPKGGAIHVASRSEAGRVVVEVTDTGIGFDAEVATRIFDAFAQASVEVTRRFGGLGLGLAISKATVDAHEGVLTAHSSGPDQGAVFTVELPLLTPPVET